MTQRTRADAVPEPAPGDGGALLLEIYRRLVPLHATLTEHGARRPDVPRMVAADLMDVLGRIEANPAFRAAEEAERRAPRA
jgi:hypothetical protein